MFENDNRGFIHTFSIVTKLSEGELNRIKTVYKDDGYFYNGDTKRGVLSAFAERGMRMEIKNCTEEEVRFDKQHKRKKAVMIFTLYKLLHPGIAFGKISERSEISNACDKILEIINEIVDKTSVNLFANAKLSRVDVTYDVVTPSEKYSQEIIRVAKKAVLKRGYVFWIPEEDEKYNEEWGKDNSVFFNSHSQEVAAKLYNKKQDKEIQDCIPETVKEKGLVRFELSLKRNYLKQNGYLLYKYIKQEELVYLLCCVTENAKKLLLQHISELLDTGDMLSKNALFKYIEIKCGNKEKKAEKMKKYVKWINKEGNQFKTYDGSASVKNYFKEFGISPIYLAKECPYIPSFNKMWLPLQENEQGIVNWVKNKNQKSGYEYKYWV